jgi:hypothetical protein
MKQEGLKERVELLEAGEKLGYPRLGYGRSTKIPHDKRIPQGQSGWELFCAHAHIRRILPALRIARVLRDNGVTPYHPLSGQEMAAKQPVAVTITRADLQAQNVHSAVVSAALVPAPDLLSEVEIPAPPLVTVAPAPRKKKGGHKKPPHPLSARAQLLRERGQRG